MINPFELVVVKPNIIPPSDIRQILEIAKSTDNSEISKATFGSTEDLSNPEIRNTLWYPIPESSVDYMTRNIMSCYVNVLEPFYMTKFEDIEGPQFLGYPVGGHYAEHNDSESFVDGKWERVCDRDISILFYLNDDYEGGQLEFTLFGLTIKPSAGMMIAFPSYKEFAHKVHPVTSGFRYSLVSWIKTKNRIYTIA